MAVQDQDEELATLNKQITNTVSKIRRAMHRGDKARVALLTYEFDQLIKARRQRRAHLSSVPLASSELTP